MKNAEGSSMAIRNLVCISIVFLFSTILTINFLPKDTVFSLAKSNDAEVITENVINIEETNQLTAEQVINNYEGIKVASVTSRSGDDFSRTDIEVTPIIEEKKSTPIEEVTISRDMDLTVRTGLSKEDFKILIANTKQDTTNFFFDNSDLIYDLCEKYELNEIFFCGLIAGESGWNIASNHRSTYNYISLMTSSGLKRFSSVEDGLEQAAKALHDNYLTEGGRFYCGKTLAGVKTRFCPASSTWVNLIYTCMGHMVPNH